MRSIFKITGTRFCVALFLAAAIVAVVIPSVSSAATSLYGRTEWKGYFSGNYSNGQAWSDCVVGGKHIEGQMICNGISSADVNNFITFYWNHLNSGSTQNSRSAAFTVLVMLGIDGPAAGGAANGVQMAKDRFREWENLVQAYNSAGKINFSHPAFPFNTNTAYRAGSGQDILWRNDADSAEVISFDIGGGKYVAIKKSCANLVGDYSALPKINNWKLSASSNAQVNSVNVTEATPGDRITWNNRVINDGPDSTTASVHSNVLLSGFVNAGWGGDPEEHGGGDTAAGAAKGTIRTIGNYSLYDVTQADVGHTLCEQVRFDPTDGKGNRNGAGNNSCVFIPYNYTLNPTVDLHHSDVVEPNTPLSITPSVSSTGPTKSKDTQWQLTQIIVQPGKTIPNETGGMTVAAQPPCGAYFKAIPDAVCSTVASGSTVFSESGGAVANSPVVVGDLSVGTRICFAFSVQPYSSSSSNWRHSAPICLTVGKKPKIQVHGGDLSVGKAFVAQAPKLNATVQTSTSNKAGAGGDVRVFGSWVEYGIFATGRVLGAGSSSASAGPTGALSSLSFCPYSTLSFKNTDTSSTTCVSGNGVGYSNIPARTIPDFVSSFPTAGAALPASVTPSGLFLPGSVYIGSTAGNLTITASDLGAGKSGILKVTGTVTITGNQTNSNGPYTSVSQLPQLVIVANKIIINSNVTNVDAWLIANGTDGVIETCDVNSSSYVLTGVQRLKSDVCDQQLTVNGPVMAKQLWLRRTAGSGTGDASGNPAEVFNLRPDAYLWATAQARASGRVQTVYTTELPSRL